MRRSTATTTALLATAALTLAACSSSSTDDGGGDAASPGTASTATAGQGTTSSTAGTGGGDEDPAPTPPPTGDGPTGSLDFSAVGPIVDDFLEERGLNGAGLVVVHRDAGVVHEQYWGDWDADRSSLVASSSKMITAGVLLHLQDEGLLDMDAPVADVADWGSAHPDITPAQLVSNSSGLVGLVGGDGASGYLCQFVPTGTLQDCAETIFTTEVDDADVVPPDTEFRYGGAQWQVAGAVAEIASGQSWADLVDETYVQPCGVESLGYTNHFLQPDVTAGAAAFEYPRGFDGDPSVLAPTDNPSMEGGVYIDVPDYGALLLMHLRDGFCGDTQVLSTEALAAAHGDRIGDVYDGTAGVGPQAAGGGGMGYGMGWWVDRSGSGIIRDPGAYGAVPWLDLEDGYGAYLVIEDRSEVGMALALSIQDAIEEAVVG